MADDSLGIIGSGPEETFASGWEGCDFIGDPTSVGLVHAKIGDKDWAHYPFSGDTTLFQYGTPSSPWEWIPIDRNYNSRPYKRFPCGAIVGNWDGGWTIKDRIEAEGGSWDDFLKSGGMVFGVAGSVLNGASQIVSTFAKNDFRKDMNGARNKLITSQNSINSEGQRLNANANGISAISGSIDSSGSTLQGLDQQIDLLKPALDSMLSDLNDLKGVLNDLASQLGDANARKVWASNRKNFPPGIEGAKAQRDALQKANADIARISKIVVDYEEKIYDKSIDLKDKSDEYNKIGQEAEALKANTLVKIGQLNNALSERKLILSNLEAGMRQRAEALNDVGQAQDTFAEKMSFAIDLSSASKGATGAKEAIGYIKTGEYFNAGGAILSSGVNIFENYYSDITPYQVFIQSAIIDGMYSLQTNSTGGDFIKKWLESTIMIQSTERLTESVGMSFQIMEKDPYFAWQNLAVETHAGINILGRWTTVALPFIPGGVTVSPLAGPAFRVASNVGSAGLSTIVETARKIEQDKWSTKLTRIGKAMPGRSLSGPADGETAVLSTVLFGGFIALESTPAELFNKGKNNPAYDVQRMALQGAQQLVEETRLAQDGRPTMRFGVDLRPIDPGTAVWPSKWWIDGGNLGGAE